jgi:hypothetical protein
MLKYSGFQSKILIFIGLLVLSLQVRAQEFGDAALDLMDYRALGGGVALQHFAPAAGNSLSDSGGIQFNAPEFHAEYRDIGTRIALGYTSYLLRGRSNSALSVEIESHRELSLLKVGRQNGIHLPVYVCTNYIRAMQNTSSTRDVNIVSIGVGSGLGARWFSKSFGIEIRGGAVIHYSTQSFSVHDGTSNQYSGEVILLFPELIGSGALVGYRYEYQAWRMKRDDLKYRREVSGPFLSIFF